MKYRIGFKNGMVISIDGESLVAMGYDQIAFQKEGEADYERYINSTEVLFVGPADHSFVEVGAVGPSIKAK